MAEKKKNIRLTTPKGVAKYPWLNKPDTKFNDKGIYKINLIIPKSECANLCAELDGLADQAYAAGLEEAKPAAKKKIVKLDPYAPEFDAEGNETENIEFKFKMNASSLNKKTGEVRTHAPALFDAEGVRVDQDKIAVYGGSVCRVNFTPVPYYNAATNQSGISLRLNAVQIIELVTGGGTAEGYGFDKQDGFKVKESTEEAGSDDTEDAADW